jgi:simple sugar transport system permease protein
MLSGGLAGLGGAVEVLGVSHRLYERFSPGYGFAAIAVALLARLNPLAVIVSAFFFAFLYAGAGSLERVAKIPSVVVYLAQGAVIFAVLLFQAGQQRRRA